MGDLLKNSIFFSDQHICYADILPSSEVRVRIEVATLGFLKNLNSSTPSVSDLPLVSRKLSNSRVSRGLLTESTRIFLSHSLSTKSLLNENSANSFIRVWKVMEMCYLILGEEKKVTQRELFYMLLSNSPQYFTSQSQVNRSIQDLVALLRCSRYSLGIMAASRGIVAGRLMLQKEPSQDIIDCSACGSSGYAISGDLNIIENLVMKSDARYIIVVEKVPFFTGASSFSGQQDVEMQISTARHLPEVS